MRTIYLVTLLVFSLPVQSSELTHEEVNELRAEGAEEEKREHLNGIPSDVKSQLHQVWQENIQHLGPHARAFEAIRNDVSELISLHQRYTSIEQDATKKLSALDGIVASAPSNLGPLLTAIIDVDVAIPGETSLEGAEVIWRRELRPLIGRVRVLHGFLTEEEKDSYEVSRIEEFAEIKIKAELIRHDLKGDLEPLARQIAAHYHEKLAPLGMTIGPEGQIDYKAHYHQHFYRMLAAMTDAVVAMVERLETRSELISLALLLDSFDDELKPYAMDSDLRTSVTSARIPYRYGFLPEITDFFGVYAGTDGAFVRERFRAAMIEIADLIVEASFADREVRVAESHFTQEIQEPGVQQSLNSARKQLSRLVHEKSQNCRGWLK